MSKAELLLGWADLQAALPAYEEAEEQYAGQVDEIFASAKIKRELAATGEAYRFNLIKTPVDVRATRCELSAVKVPDNEAATERVGEVWDANDMAIYYPGLIKDTFIYGDAYVMVWAVDEEPEETSDDQLIQARVEFTTQNPKNGRMVYDPEDQRRKWFFLKRWCLKSALGQETWRVDLYFADTIERWVSVQGQNLESEDGWTEYVEDDEELSSWELPNPYGEVPFFHHRTAVPFGRPVHIDGYGCQNAVNKMLITQLTTTDSQGFPQRYALVDKDAVLDEQSDDPQWVDDEDATGYTVEGLSHQGGQGSALRSGPGTMQTHTGIKEVGQFPAAEPGVFLDPAQVYIRLMAQITGTPLHYFDPSGDVPSGESLRVAEAPLVKDIEWLQLLQGSAVKEEWRFALLLLGIRVPNVEVRWASVASATGKSDWETVGLKIANGVPQDQALVETGYEPEQVAAWLDADAEAATLATRVALLGQIGTAIQSIGAGVALGVVSEEEARATIAIVLSQVNASGQGADPS